MAVNVHVNGLQLLKAVRTGLAVYGAIKLIDTVCDIAERPDKIEYKQEKGYIEAEFTEVE